MTPPKLKHHKRTLLDRIHAMPVPGVLDLTHADWIPSDKWLRTIPQADLSVRRTQNKTYIFRIG